MILQNLTYRLSAITKKSIPSKHVTHQVAFKIPNPIVNGFEFTHHLKTHNTYCCVPSLKY